jgi:hypothetical protein
MVNAVPMVAEHIVQARSPSKPLDVILFFKVHIAFHCPLSRLSIIEILEEASMSAEKKFN